MVGECRMHCKRRWEEVMALTVGRTKGRIERLREFTEVRTKLLRAANRGA